MMIRGDGQPLDSLGPYWNFGTAAAAGMAKKSLEKRVETVVEHAMRELLWIFLPRIGHRTTGQSGPSEW